MLENQLAEFEENYRRRVKNYSKCDLDKPAYKNSEFNTDINRKTFVKKLQKDVAQISNFMTSVMDPNSKAISKSSSEPRLVMKTGISEDDLEIEEYWVDFEL